MASLFHGLSCLIPILCIILLFPHTAISQTNITVGSFIVAGDDKALGHWLSPSGDFAFGFSQVENNDTFLLTMWFDKIPEKTIVWLNKEIGPVPRGSRLEVTSDRGLVINDQKGGFLWSTDTVVSRVTHGFFEDSGNFGLRDEYFETTWETFDNPTDTILPGQEIRKNGVILISRGLGSNVSGEGRFRLYLKNRTVQLKTVNLPGNYENEPYYSSNGSDASTSPARAVGFNRSTGYIYILRQNGVQSPLNPGIKVVSSQDYYLRATLEFDGVFIQYSYPKNVSAGERKWSAIWLVPDNICVSSFMTKGSGVCGYNRICRLGVDHRPNCECPRGFSLLDQSDDYRGCIPSFSQGCEVSGPSSTQDEFVLDEVANIDWPTTDYEVLQPFREDECKDACLRDCMCAVTIFGSGNMCWKKKLPLSNGRADGNLSKKAFIKRRKYGSELQSPGSPSSGSNNKNALIIAGSALLGSSVFLNFMLMGAIGLGFFMIYHKKLSRIFKDEGGLDVNIRCFTYRELEDATNGFKEELGRGSFGIVFKGLIDIGNDSNSRTEVAIKKLDRLFQESEREFKTEVLVIGQTHHKNLVRLLGYCNEGQNRLLVYECLSNGSLASFLFGDEMKPTWEQRVQIALDVGKGLLYLHEECSTQIIHCDIKPQNILLDENYGARISDFGLAKLLLLSQTHTNTAIRGTRGYVAPEWFRNQPITVKVDVYSFGILLLEIICCRRSVDIEIGGEDKVILADWAYDCYREKTIDALVEKDEEAISDSKRLERFVMVAIWCIQEDPSLRPTMKKVMLMLEGIIQVSIPPCPFPFSTITTV
ncbi:G-type lectin S-receptor-like serine/threonine-protein kinase LECRK4 [Punica granatum]|uniref:Receptor-like serine/threonine-protein kinase n=1 Tax=Punica granatum TaxID=22663 RepID=A0A6P8D801_PUNGR|nr:G-type lectin S-receptor-like serine/threonine-protein kinase LECRK4 [Punica granatum]